MVLVVLFVILVCYPSNRGHHDSADPDDSSRNKPD